MLTRWSLENFKSVRKRTNIDFAPITVLAGANSSGKSTIIQSILLIKQTLQYAQPTRVVALNGPLLKLGTFGDIRNVNAETPHIGISWNLTPEPEKRRSWGATPLDAGPYFYLSEADPDFVSTECEIRLDAERPRQDLMSQRPSASDEFLQLNPSLSYVNCRSEYTSTEGRLYPKISLSRYAGDLAEKRRSLHITEELTAAASGALRYNVEIDPQTKHDITQPRPDSQIIGANIRHFFPFQIGIRYDQAKERARLIAEFLTTRSRTYRYRYSEILNERVPPEVVDAIIERLQEDSVTPSFLQGIDTSADLTVEQLAERLRRLATRSRTTGNPSAGILGDMQSQIEELLAAVYPSTMNVEFEYSRGLFEAIEFTRNFFVSSVRYLGPLRDEPKPIYPLEALANPSEVGYRGEHTAAVLDLHRNSIIEYIPSDAIGKKESPQPKRASLHDAVVDWLTYVEVATEVSTGDRGKIGHQLQVQTRGVASFHDLTNVGVGVSQILPIIVMALLAEPPSLLIFEQPELHLHPRVQARLGDFFLSVALLGKQCILETHSEYLVERLRLRIAEADGDSLTPILKIYFTERVSGDTTLRPAGVSRYGAISDYPQDFFDQSIQEGESIVRAAVKKRALERDSK